MQKLETSIVFTKLENSKSQTDWPNELDLSSIIWLDAWNKRTYKKTKLEEFKFGLIRLIHRKLKYYLSVGIKQDGECLYCGKKDSIDPTFLNHQFVKTFVNNIIDWFNSASNSKFASAIEMKLFGIISGPYKNEILKNLIVLSYL